MEQRAVDEVQPLIYDLSDRLNKVRKTDPRERGADRKRGGKRRVLELNFSRAAGTWPFFIFVFSTLECFPFRRRSCFFFSRFSSLALRFGRLLF